MGQFSIERLKKEFSGGLKEYRSIPFWSWNNELDENELVTQICEMKKVGIGGFIMHARTGLTTEYLGEKWFSCVKACLEKAKELNMGAWIYDENGWPSGFVGGKLLEKEEYRARFLEYEVKSEFDSSAFCVFKRTTKGYERVYRSAKKIKEYHTIYLKISPANTDILNPDVVTEFIEQTHEKYYQRFASSFGKELVGFFTDEPQYYRWGTPYPVKVKDEFNRKYGEDVMDGLIYLFVHDEEGYPFRTKYYTTLNEMYVKNFYKRLYDWCEMHGCKLTGHSVEEPHLYTQMWGGGGVMSSYEYQHVPGIDSLGFQGEPVLSARQIGSVAAQLGYKFILTETFGCGGYDVTPYDLKHVGEMQYFNGVNVMCQHLLPYSLAGQGKHDHPPVFYKQNNWWKESIDFNEYFARLGYIIANTVDMHDILVIHPMRSVYLNYIRSEDLDSVRELEDKFEELLAKLNRNGILYHLADETILSRHGRIQDGKLIIGNITYEKVLIPDMPTISKSTLKLLRDFKGKLCTCGNIEYVDGVKSQVDLTPNSKIEELYYSSQIPVKIINGTGAVTARAGDIGEFLFIKNHSIEDEMHVFLTTASNYATLNLQTMQLTQTEMDIRVPRSGSVILVKAQALAPAYNFHLTENITSDFKVTSISDNSFVIDTAKLSKDGQEFSEELPLPQIFENLLYNKFKGRIYLKHTFKLNEKMPLKLTVEKNDYKEITVNGKEISFYKSNFDINFLESDITKVIKEGENEIVYSLDYYQRDIVRFAFFDPLATEAVRNCLYYDTHIENVYLNGDFIVENDRSLSKRKAFPSVTATLYKEGYPFFYGEVEYTGKYIYDGKGCPAICVKGRFVALNLEVNGKEVNVLFNEKKDLTNLLKKGYNEIVIRVKSSLRNLMGPHHNKYHFERRHVCPDIFTLYKTWKDGVSDGYTSDYSLVPFGIDEIEILK